MSRLIIYFKNYIFQLQIWGSSDTILSVGYFFNPVWVENDGWNSHFVKCSNSWSYSTWQPPISCTSSWTHQIHILRAANSSCQPLNESFQPRDLQWFLLYYFDWLFLRLRITLTYCSSAVLWICTVFWFQPSPGLKYCFIYLTLRLFMETRCPTQKTEGGGSFCTMWPVFCLFVCWSGLSTWHQDNPSSPEARQRLVHSDL